MPQSWSRSARSAMCVEAGLLSREGVNGVYRWGFVDRTGETVIPFVYYGAESFKNGKAKVKDSNGNWCYIYKNNVRVTE